MASGGRTRPGPWPILPEASLSAPGAGAGAGRVQGGKCTIGQLAEEMRAGPGRESGRLKVVLEEVADGDQVRG
jgi:hypothetical protein